ncbi:MAG: hypothetical protein M5R36_21545 [Deltaproteobacteria bacterium]|nr:hypothetical protein [Deltaproteobacteria bacterium]
MAADDDGAALTLSRFLRQHGKRLIPRFYEHNGLFKKRDKMEIALMNLIIKFGEPNSKAVAAVKKNMFTIQWKEPNWSLNDLL